MNMRQIQSCHWSVVDQGTLVGNRAASLSSWGDMWTYSTAVEPLYATWPNWLMSSLVNQRWICQSVTIQSTPNEFAACIDSAYSISVDVFSCFKTLAAKICLWIAEQQHRCKGAQVSLKATVALKIKSALHRQQASLCSFHGCITCLTSRHTPAVSGLTWAAVLLA